MFYESLEKQFSWNLMLHREINVKLVFHEILRKKNFSVYPSLPLRKILLNSLCILRKVSVSERNLSKVTPATLLILLYLTDNFLEVH